MSNKIKHSTAGASHYDNSAKNYDRFNEENSKQIYSLKELSEMLIRNGFEVLEYSDIDGSKFVDDKTERIFIVAKKSKLYYK